MFKNLSFYSFVKPVDWEGLNEKLAARPCPVVGPQDTSRSGWAEPVEGNGYVLNVDDATLICLQTDEKVLPQDVIRREVNQRAKAIEKEQGRPLRRKERNNIRDEVVLEFLPRAFVRTKHTYAFITGDSVVVCAAARPQCEHLLTELRETLGSLPVRPMLTDYSPSFVMSRWVQCASNGPRDPALTLGDKCKMAGADKEKASFVNIDPYAEEVRELVEHGLQVAELQLCVEGAASFELTEDLRFRSIHLNESIREELDGAECEDYLQRFRTEFFLFSRTMTRVKNLLAEEFGGIYTP